MKRLIKTNKIRIGDISISYFIKEAKKKSGKTIIFIHGFPFNKNSWRPQLEALADHVTGIAIDVRGHGLSTMGHGFFSIDVFAKDLKVFIEKLNLDHIVICGVSMGGYIALRTYELFPEKIAGLILSDTHHRADDNQAKQKRFDSIQAVLEHGRRPFSIGFANNLLAAKSIEELPEVVELVKSSIRRNNISSICSTLLALASRTDTSAVLPNIDIPTLIIRGAEDKITPKSLMEELHQSIPQSKYIEMKGCGHLPNLENAKVFNQLMNDFLLKDI